jgi:large subunit ribosomal protein L13
VLSLSDEIVYIDGTNHILGRLASKVAKLILSGKRVVVVNSEKILISGSRESVIEEWKTRLEIKSRVNPIYGPIHYRRPDRLFKRVVRGMVPREKPKGKNALKRLRVYIGIPEGLSGKKFEIFEELKASRPVPLYISVAELSRSLGWAE